MARDGWRYAPRTFGNTREAPELHPDASGGRRMMYPVISPLFWDFRNHHETPISRPSPSKSEFPDAA